MSRYDEPGAAAKYQQAKQSAGGSVRYRPPLTLGNLGSGFTLDRKRRRNIPKTLSGPGYGQSRPPQDVDRPDGYTSPWTLGQPGARPPKKPDGGGGALPTGEDTIPVQYDVYQPTGYDTVDQSPWEPIYGSPVIYGSTGPRDWLDRGQGADAARWQGMADRSKYRAGFDPDAWWKRMQEGLYADYINYLKDEDEMQPEPEPVYFGGGYGGGGWGGWGGGGGYTTPYDFFFNRMNWRI